MKVPIISAMIATLFIVTGVASPANAQAVDAVTIPYGDWLAQLLAGVSAVVLPLVTYAFRKLPRNAGEFLFSKRVDQLLDRALTYGINATANAVKGKTLDLQTGNLVVNMAIDYATKHAPKLIDEFGVQMLREKILARIDLDDVAELPAPALPAGK